MNALPDSAPGSLAAARSATALSQDGDGAQVLAQGQGEVAAQMTAVANEHHIPVLQDFALSEALQKMPVGTQIPEPLFRALGGLLDFLFREEAGLAQQDEREE